MPEPKAFRIDNRTLYFDSISNRYGVFLRISQVWASSRTAITIPDRSLNQFRDIINELAGSISSAMVCSDVYSCILKAKDEVSSTEATSEEPKDVESGSKNEQESIASDLIQVEKDMSSINLSSEQPDLQISAPEMPAD